MAAAMRFAARRLTGGQRAKSVYKAVVSPLVEAEGERRRLMPRLINGDRPTYFPQRSMSSGGDGGNTALKEPCAKPALDLDAKRAWGHSQIVKSRPRSTTSSTSSLSLIADSPRVTSTSERTGSLSTISSDTLSPIPVTPYGASVVQEKD